MLVAIGITASGHRRVLGVSVALSEAEMHWRAFLDSLIQRRPVARQIRAIFNASDSHEAQRLLNVAFKEWQVSHPQLAAWAEINLTEGFAVFGLPDAHRKRMRTINGLERLNMKHWPDAIAQQPQNQNRNLQTRCCFIKQKVWLRY